MGQVDAPTPDMVRMAQEAELAPATATPVTEKEARGDAGVYEISEAEGEMVCIIQESGEQLYQPSHWGSEGEGWVEAGPVHMKVVE